ncbi:MAG: zf-HC2 domain-containing protein [Desulfobulbaceae bacterium]|nr:zf-HC2 domain-containing protein [Desulfobulbaceae bacterium]
MTNSINCDSSQDLFSALADGELDVIEIARIEDHLKTCRQCAKEWQLFKEGLAWLHEVEPVSAPADLLTGIYAKLERSNPITNWLQDLFGSPFRALSSLAVIGIALFFWIANDASNHTPAGSMADAGAINQPRIPVRQLQTIPVVNRASRSREYSPATSTYRLSRLPIFSPDISITVHAATDEAKERLCKRIASQNQWHIQPVQGGLLIYLNEQEIPHLQHTLAPHRLTMVTHPSINTQKRRLRTVNLRISTQ